MKLYIKQKVFSWADRFAVKDSGGNDVFYVEGEIFSLGKKLHIYDVMQRELASVEERIFTFMPKYQIYIGGQNVAEIVKRFTLFSSKFDVLGTDLSVEGDFWSHSYQVYQNGMVVASVDKEWFTWGDSYCVDVGNGGNAVFMLAVVLAIDAALEKKNNN